MSTNERTYIMIKPDGVQRGLVGEIIKRFEQRGYHLAGLKMVHVSVHAFINEVVNMSEKLYIIYSFAFILAIARVVERTLQGFVG